MADTSLSAIKKIEIAARTMPGVVSLAQGVPFLQSDQRVRDAVLRAIADNKADKYSSGRGVPELRHLIAEKLRDNGMHYDPEEEIIVTAGSIEGLSATILALADPEDEVLVLTPTYFSNYQGIAHMARARIVQVPLDEGSGWQANMLNLEAAITPRTKILIICNPNNPTGTVLAKEELSAFGAIARRHNLFVVCDDVYRNLAYGQNASCFLGDGGFRNRTIRLVSLSKDFALSGWRIGYLHGPKDLVSRIAAVHDNLVNCAPAVSQYAAIAALSHEQEIVPRNIEAYRKNRDLMGELLGEMRDVLSFSMPQGAYYYFPRISGVEDSAAFCLDLLEQAKVAAVPGSEFGEGGEGHIRLCFGRSPAEIEEGLARLRRYLSAHSAA